MATWPTGLHGPENNVDIKPGSTLKERRLESGRREVRRFGSGAPDLLTVTFRFDATDLATFEEFFEFDCNLGVNWFTASWLSILGYSSRSLRFLGYPSIRAIENDLYNVSATLIVQITTDVAVSDTDWPILRT